MNNKLGCIITKLTSPKAYSTYAAIGVGVTVVLAILNTRKQCQIENEKKAQGSNSEEQMTREEVKEEVKTAIKNYAPTMISAIGTVYCINKAESKWIDYNGMLSAGIFATQNKLDKLRATVPGLAASEIIRSFSHQKADEGKQWFCIKGFDTEPDIFFQSTIADVIYAEYCLNRFFLNNGSASVFTFFEFLDILDKCPAKYSYLGWDYDYFASEYDSPQFIWLDFVHSHAIDLESGEDITEISYRWNPIYNPSDEPYSDPWNYIPCCYNSPHE